MRRRRGPEASRVYHRLVRERYEVLYSQALEAVKRGDYSYARMLTGLIRRMAERTRVRPPRRIKRGICKNCGLPLVPGLTARVRLRSQGRLFAYRVVACLGCGWLHRYPYKPYKRRGSRPGEGVQGEPQGEGEGGAPLEPGRHYREERHNGRGHSRDQEEAQG